VYDGRLQNRDSEESCTRDFLPFMNTTAIAYHQNREVLTDFLPVCISRCVHKRQKITSSNSCAPCWRCGNVGCIARVEQGLPERVKEQV